MRVLAQLLLFAAAVGASAAASAASAVRFLAARALPEREDKEVWNATENDTEPDTTLTTTTTVPVRESQWIKGTWTTGYWDCCKPSCAWMGKGHVDHPARSCDAKTGKVLLDSNVKSVCTGGSAASCTDNKPFHLLGKNLSMGFAAAAVSGNHGLTGDANCGQCFELRFVDQSHDGGSWGGAAPALVGKSMIVQVTNIGYDVTGEHSFDIQIPGAGQGAFQSGCQAQFSGFSSGDFDCDTPYGGCADEKGCSRLPQELQAGCKWRYDWFHWMQMGGKTNNPYVDFRRVRCPELLTSISGSVPLDDAEYPPVDVNSYV